MPRRINHLKLAIYIATQLDRRRLKGWWVTRPGVTDEVLTPRPSRMYHETVCPEGPVWYVASLLCDVGFVVRQRRVEFVAWEVFGIISDVAADDIEAVDALIERTSTEFR